MNEILFSTSLGDFSALTIISILIGVVGAYLFGSINFAIIITKIIAKKDIRDFGSGNAGMTNVLRTLGKGPAVLTILGDVSKGVLAVLVTRLLVYLIAGQTDIYFGEYIAAMAALIGHVYPVFYGFKGGKGVLVSAGAMLVLAPVGILVAVIVFLIIVACTKIVSLGSIGSVLAFATTVLIMGVITNSPTVFVESVMSYMIALTIVVMHRSNIKRLIRGEENKFGQKKK